MADPSMDPEQSEMDTLTEDGVALLSAARTGDIDAARYLLTGEGNASKKTTAPAISTQSHSLATRQRKLLQFRHPVSGDTALIVASFRGKNQLVEYLLRLDTFHPLALDVNARDANGCSALIAATQCQNYAIVELLVGDPRTDVAAGTARGTTALMMACKKDNADLVRLLIQCGPARCGLTLKDDRGSAAFDYCGPKTEPLVTAAMNQLAARQQRPARTLDPESAEIRALEAEVFGAAFDNDLIKLGALLSDVRLDINTVQTPHRLTPLAVAAHKGFAGIVERLLRDPLVDVNARGKTGPTPFILAAKAGHRDVLELLLRDPRCNLNARCAQGTGFIMACMSDNLEVLTLLLDNADRMDLDAKDSKGKTGLDYCKTDVFRALVLSSIEIKAQQKTKVASHYIRELVGPRPRPRPVVARGSRPLSMFAAAAGSNHRGARPLSMYAVRQRPVSMVVGMGSSVGAGAAAAGSSSVPAKSGNTLAVPGAAPTNAGNGGYSLASASSSSSDFYEPSSSSAGVPDIVVSSADSDEQHLDPLSAAAAAAAASSSSSSSSSSSAPRPVSVSFSNDVTIAVPPAPTSTEPAPTPQQQRKRAMFRPTSMFMGAPSPSSDSTAKTEDNNNEKAAQGGAGGKRRPLSQIFSKSSSSSTTTDGSAPTNEPLSAKRRPLSIFFTSSHAEPEEDQQWESEPPQLTPDELRLASQVEDFVEACRQGNVGQVATSLLRRGFDPNLANAAGDTGVHAACGADQVEVLARLLKDRRIDFDLIDAQGRTGIYIAAANDFIDTVEFLYWFPERVDATIPAITVEEHGPIKIEHSKKPAEVAGPKTRKLIKEMVNRKHEILAKKKVQADEAKKKAEKKKKQELEQLTGVQLSAA